jgi:hypothetical protein
MTIIEYRPAHPVDDEAAVQAVAFLVDDPAAPNGGTVPVVVISPSGAPLDPFGDGSLRGLNGSSTTVSDLLRDMPVLDEWIVDLALRNGRVAVLTRQHMLCSAPLLPTPSGWTAAVASRGLLDVVLQGDIGIDGTDTVPTRAVQEPGLTAARVPVCLT